MNSDGYFSVPDGPIDIETENHICHRLSLSQFAILSRSISYEQAQQIGEELSSRISRISLQITSRGDQQDYDWRHKAQNALSIVRQKKTIIQSRLNSIRNNNLSSIVRSIGFSNISSKRLAIIKCLISIIDLRLQISSLSPEEHQLLDLARSVSGSEEKSMSGFSFDPTRMAIVAPDGSDVAIMSNSGVLAEEQGYILARTWDMIGLLDRVAEGNFADLSEVAEIKKNINMLLD